jgi:hypothetical protein
MHNTKPIKTNNQTTKTKKKSKRNPIKKKKEVKFATKRKPTEYFKNNSPLKNPPLPKHPSNETIISKEKQRDSWLRSNTINRINKELKEAARQDPTNAIDILDPPTDSNLCQYTWRDIQLLETITRRIRTSTLTCSDRKCFFHNRRF